MPQVVEVLKYIHEITDNDHLGTELIGDTGKEELEYQRLGRNVNKELSALRNTLNEINSSEEHRSQVTVIDRYLE
jgi:hypothetical protein